MLSPKLSWIQILTDESLLIRIDISIYPLEALFRVCYSFTDRCYIFLEEESASVIKVHFAKKTEGCDLSVAAGEFSNDLINQKVRLDVARETKSIRELIVAQAFAEADLLDESDQEANYLDDPRGISK